MSEETYSTTEPRETSHTTVIHERGSNSGMGIIVAVVLLIAVIGGIYLYSQQSSSEVTKNNAITQAANKVGNAASDVGSAAKDAANNTSSN